MTPSPDVIIIGGGALGSAIAYYLAGMRAGRVVLLERRTLGGQSSAKAAGLISQARPHAAVIPLVLETFHAIANLEDELDQSLGVHQVGSLHVASSPPARASLVELRAASERWGVLVSQIDACEAVRRVPWLALRGSEELVLAPGDAYLDSYLLTRAYAEVARRRGVLIRERIEVKAIQRQGDRVVGVETDDGLMPAEVVIDAAGAWAGVLAWRLGIGLPMAPVRSHYWVTQPFRRFTPSHPIVFLPDARAYLRSELGSLLFGFRESKSLAADPWQLPADTAHVVLDGDPNGWNSLLECLPGLRSYFPEAEQTQIAHYVSGLSTYTPDGMFVLGEVPGIRGLLVATGCSGAGIAASGGVGLALAELAAGYTPSFDLSPHRIDRFGQVDPTDPGFRERCAEARSAKQSA